MKLSSVTFGRRWFVKLGIGAVISALGIESLRHVLSQSRRNSPSWHSVMRLVAPAVLPAGANPEQVAIAVDDFTQWISDSPHRKRKEGGYVRDARELQTASLESFAVSFSQLSLVQRQKLLMAHAERFGSFPSLAKDFLNRYFQSTDAMNRCYGAQVNPLTARPLFQSLSKPRTL